MRSNPPWSRPFRSAFRYYFGLLPGACRGAVNHIYQKKLKTHAGRRAGSRTQDLGPAPPAGAGAAGLGCPSGWGGWNRLPNLTLGTRLTLHGSTLIPYTPNSVQCIEGDVARAEIYVRSYDFDLNESWRSVQNPDRYSNLECLFESKFAIEISFRDWSIFPDPQIKVYDWWKVAASSARFHHRS